MSKFNPEKLSVEYNNGTTATTPIIPRYYTLTHSDLTGKLFLNIGKNYAWENVNPMRDEVLGKWKQYGTSLFFYVYLHIDQGEFTQSVSKRRNEIFRRELPLALSAIRYGDQFLFNIFPSLDQAPIVINFMSAYPEFAKQEIWGTFQHLET